MFDQCTYFIHKSSGLCRNFSGKMPSLSACESFFPSWIFTDLWGELCPPSLLHLTVCFTAVLFFWYHITSSFVPIFFAQMSSSQRHLLGAPFVKFRCCSHPHFPLLSILVCCHFFNPLDCIVCESRRVPGLIPGKLPALFTNGGWPWTSHLTLPPTDLPVYVSEMLLQTRAIMPGLLYSTRFGT